MDPKLMPRLMLLVAVMLLNTPAPAVAQMPDYCSKDLAAKDGPKASLDWIRLCTIQKLESERVAEADRATQDEVEIARLKALQRALQKDLEAAKAKAKQHEKAY